MVAHVADLAPAEGENLRGEAHGAPLERGLGARQVVELRRARVRPSTWKIPMATSLPSMMW